MTVSDGSDMVMASWSRGGRDGDEERGKGGTPPTLVGFVLVVFSSSHANNQRWTTGRLRSWGVGPNGPYASNQ